MNNVKYTNEELKSLSEKQLHQLIEETYGPNKGNGLFGRMAWFYAHKNKLLDTSK